MTSSTATLLPVNLLVAGRDCLIVGGGKTAARKAKGLIGVGAVVGVVAPTIGPEMRALVDDGIVKWTPRRFESTDTTGCFIVFAATDLRDVNIAVADACRDAGALCGVVDAGWQRVRRPGLFLRPAER